jgi:predicted MFS family arabinose efflux permease
VSILLLGPALLGRAESFIITGAVSWGLVLVGTKNAGRVIAWIGTAMFAALALGAPLGTALYSARGFAGVAIAATLMPLLTVALVALLSPVPPQHGAGPSLRTVAAAVWLPGFGAALSSIGFGAIIAFSSLLSAQRGWSPVWLLFTAFGLSLVAARLMLGHVSDRLGGARVALVCVLIQAVGLALIWFAPDGASAATGAALAGFGYSLVYPRPWRRSRAPRSAAKPRPRHGCLHSLSRCGARLWQSDTWAGRRPVRPRCGVALSFRSSL